MAKASVNLVTNTAAVWVQNVLDVNEVVEKAAAIVTEKGFPTTLRPTGAA